MTFTLSVPRFNMAATTINYNGVEYAVFGGGFANTIDNTVDFIYLTGSGSNITPAIYADTILSDDR